MSILTFLLWNIAAPAGVSAMVVGLAGRLAGAGWQARWGIAVGLGLGYLAGHQGILGWPPLPTLDANATVAWLALAATLLGSVEAMATTSPRFIWVGRGVLVALILALLLRTRIENTWTVLESAAWLGGLGFAVLGSWWNLESQAQRMPGPGWMFHLALVSAGWAAVQLICGGASLGQLDGVLGSAALGTLPVIGFRPGVALSRGGAAVAITVLTGLGLTGYFYSEIPWGSAVLLSLAPWAPWIDRVGAIRGRSPWTRSAIRVLAVLLVVGGAVLLAESLLSPTMEDGPSI